MACIRSSNERAWLRGSWTTLGWGFLFPSSAMEMLYLGIVPFIRLVDSAGTEISFLTSVLVPPNVDMATDASSFIFSSLKEDKMDFIPESDAGAPLPPIPVLLLLAA